MRSKFVQPNNVKNISFGSRLSSCKVSEAIREKESFSITNTNYLYQKSTMLHCEFSKTEQGYELTTEQFDQFSPTYNPNLHLRWSIFTTTQPQSLNRC